MGQRILDEARYICPKCGGPVSEWRTGMFGATYQICNRYCGWKVFNWSVPLI